MEFSPKVSIVERKDQSRGYPRDVDETILRLLVEFVRERVDAICAGPRSRVQTTYDPSDLESLEDFIEDEDYERTSWLDWYMNQMERGLGSPVTEIVIEHVDDFSLLPFRDNANWTVNRPDYALHIHTEDTHVLWFVKLFDEDDDHWRLAVVLPSFVDAPWKEPILETLGGITEFHSATFARDLAERLGLEFCCWAERFRKQNKIRAFALSVNPSSGMIHPCLLTDRESFNEQKIGKWCLGEWRFYCFTQAPHSSWPYGQELCDLMKQYIADKEESYVHPKFDDWAQSKEDFEVIISCANALREPEFLEYLRRFELSNDFELGVFHSHDERSECNFYLQENQDLSVLVKQ